MPENDNIKHKPITDLTFFTNESDQTLLDRFKVTIEQNTRFFDVLVGFFRTSGFFKLYKSLEKTEKIGILVGISLNRYAYELIQKANPPSPPFTQHFHRSAGFSKGGMGGFLHFSHSEAKDDFKENVISEMENAPDKPEVQEGVEKFIEWIKSGLIENLEFNVELKNRADYDFAIKKFNELWSKSVPVSEDYVETINTKT
jgi:hypothetical protein